MNDLRIAAQNLVDKLLAEFGWSPGEFPALDELRAQLNRPDPEPVGEVIGRYITERERVEGVDVWLNDKGEKLPIGTELYAMPQSLAPECNETTDN